MSSFEGYEMAVREYEDRLTDLRAQLEAVTADLEAERRVSNDKYEAAEKLIAAVTAERDGLRKIAWELARNYSSHMMRPEELIRRYPELAPGPDWYSLAALAPENAQRERGEE